MDKLEKFHSDLEVEKLIAQDNHEPLAMVEAPREIIEYFNRGQMIHAFDRVGYFLYQGAAVCETGKKEHVLEQMAKASVLSPVDWQQSKK